MSSGTQRSAAAAGLHGSVDGDDRNTKARYSNDSSSLIPSARITSLADVELQLIMQCLDSDSLLHLARASKQLLRAADDSFAWKCIELHVPISTDARVAQLVIDASVGVARHGSLFIHHVTHDVDGQRQFTPIDLTPLLTRRVIRLYYGLPFDAIAVTAVRQMQWLVELELHYITRLDRPTFDQLLAPGHRLQRLERFDFDIDVDEAVMQLLVGLPSLQTFNVSECDPVVCGNLAQLHQLTQVSINSTLDFTDEQMHAFMAALATMHQLRRLTIILSAHEQRVMVLPPLPRLERLWIGLANVQSFAFLQHSPHLEYLVVVDCTGFTNDEFVDALLTHWPVHIKRLHVSNSKPFEPEQRLRITHRMQRQPQFPYRDTWSFEGHEF